ncbi:hypothetical protein PsalMR5_00771 [Piscirickettsia salmonis]|uniref:hypothetical protein n=1 Tax=Piscirickettsia salmonis TaxID=1238 RepID=UPI0012BA9413|nr:hypothetical protein [Piscirickettsia salmonis]QGP53363.1 hypothetical protein PsalSR1_00773 [Piscirickettsia salmonis]QGP60718.1 hypothetical protein PsalBI1_03337 [Piscirickettsia salmonis]QGP62928.1 hypothetical protein PsalMR5_00771 [Piscirickettsia salmonis]
MAITHTLKFKHINQRHLPAPTNKKAYQLLRAHTGDELVRSIDEGVRGNIQHTAEGYLLGQRHFIDAIQDGAARLDAKITYHTHSLKKLENIDEVKERSTEKIREAKAEKEEYFKEYSLGDNSDD